MQSSTITLFREENARHTPGVFLGDISLTMSYFHTGIRTIIGAEAFHCPVRDGKEWDHLAMVIRLNLSPPRSGEPGDQFAESESADLIAHRSSLEDRHNSLHSNI